MTSALIDLGGHTNFSKQKRALLFLALMILLAVVLWRMSSTKTANQPAHEIIYSEFLDHLDKNEIQSATFYLYQSAAKIEGGLRGSGEKFVVTIPKEAIPEITKQLREHGIPFGVHESAQPDWLAVLSNAAPVILLVAIWIFMMRRMQSQGRPPGPGVDTRR